LIGKLLSGAVKLYLRSQVERVEALQIEIEGKNKQILQGYIPQVFLSCDRAIYQGLHLSQIQLKGTDIAINLPEVIKKQPLKLIEPIFVEIQLRLDAEDLQASLKSDLLQSGLNDLWQQILAEQNFSDLAAAKVEWQHIAIADRQLNLTGSYQDSGTAHQLALSIKIELANDHTLCLSPLNVTSESQSNSSLDSRLEIDLGTDIDIAKLKIEFEQIVCAGNIKVNN